MAPLHLGARVVIAVALTSAVVHAAEVRVLSPAAVKGSLTETAAAFERETSKKFGVKSISLLAVNP